MGRATHVLVDGLYFGEGPRWRGDRLWFSDFYDHAVKSVSLLGDVRTELALDDQPSGLGWLPDGSLLVVSMTRKKVLRRGLDGALGVHADLGEIAGFHCNDMVVDDAGRAYVGNFGFNLDAELAARGAPSVLGDHVAATLAMIALDGSVQPAATDMHFPNGSVITPDGKTLIVGETLSAALTAFDIAPDGGLSGRRLWASTQPRLPDGIALDAEGAIWIANPLAPECVRIKEGGDVLEVIETDQPCFACMLGGEDGRTLFMLTAVSSGRRAAEARTGKILTALVDHPHAGRP